MNDKLSELSKNEWILMKISWHLKKATARKIYEKALLKKSWEYQTVKTMLDRLVKKGYLLRDKFGPICVYEAKILRSKVVYDALENFLSTTFDNAVMPIFTHFVKEKKFSNEDIKSMKKMIEEYEERNHGNE